MRKNIIGYLFGVIFILVGAGFILSAVSKFIDERNFAKTAVEGTGAIIEIMHGSSFQGGMGSTGGKPVITDIPRIRFQTSDGKSTEFIGGESRVSGWSVGQTIPILYDPNNPTGARLKSYQPVLTIFYIVFPIVGSFLLLIGILIFVSPIYSGYKKRKEEQNKLAQ